MYTLADAVRLKEHVLEKWEAADKKPELAEDGALNIVVVGGGPTGVESAGALIELYRGDFSKDYPSLPQEKARIVLVEAGAELFAMFKKNLRTYTKKALEDRGVEVLVGETVASVAPDPRHAQVGQGDRAHTLVWGAGLEANPIVESLGLELEQGNRIPVEPDLRVEGHPEVFAVGDIAWITDTKTSTVLRSWARSRCRPVRGPARTSPDASRGKRPSRSSTTTRGRWRRSDGAQQSSSSAAGGR